MDICTKHDGDVVYNDNEGSCPACAIQAKLDDTDKELSSALEKIEDLEARVKDLEAK